MSSHEELGYKLQWGPEGVEKVEYTTAKKIDDHYVLFYNKSVIGVSHEREDAEQRLMDMLRGQVKYANNWARGVKYTLEDRTLEDKTKNSIAGWANIRISAN